MNPIQAVRAGIRAVNRTRRMWFVFWFYDTVFALFVALPLGAMLAGDLGQSLYSRQMLANFDIQWFSEFALKSNVTPMAILAPAAMIVAGAFFLLSTFLYGGALTVFAGAEGRYRPGLFYQGCGRNFGRLFRLLLLSGVLYGIVFLAMAALRGVGDRIWENGMEGRPLVIFGWFRLGLLILLFLVVNMVFDYAKIRLVVEDRRGAVRACFASCALVARNFGRCAGTYALVALLAVAFFAVYFAVSGLLPREVWWGLLLVFLVQQAFILSRIWAKLLFLAGQSEMYAALKPARPAVEPARQEAVNPAGESPEATAEHAVVEPALESAAPAEPDRQPARVEPSPGGAIAVVSDPDDSKVVAVVEPPAQPAGAAENPDRE